MAEPTGLMHEITHAVLALALDHAVALRDSGSGVPIAVNLSASDLLDATLADAVFDGLRSRRLPPDALQIEITETLLMGDREQTRSLLERLRDHGILLAVDDYGTGYSLLAYLHDLPVHKLKIDRAFTDRLLRDAKTATIVRSTLQLAHDLGLEVVAEGVETQEQRDWLYAAGADTAQGWLISRPMGAEASLQWLREECGVAGTTGHARPCAAMEG
jgi:EAL domain-containing protein (putative c-di-GMP-specific phosphodiesterase class I)